MLQIFKEMGMYGPPLLIISIVNLALALRCVVGLAASRPAAPNSVNAILFWGGVAALLGFLGQHTGLYHALNVISGAKQISPPLVAQGFAESFSTTIFGMTILLLSAIAWFALGAWNRKVSRVAAV